MPENAANQIGKDTHEQSEPEPIAKQSIEIQQLKRDAGLV